MSIIETLAVFVGIPALIYGGIAVATLAPGRRTARGEQTWDHGAQWWAGDTPIQIPADLPAGSTRGGARGAW